MMKDKCTEKQYEIYKYCIKYIKNYEIEWVDENENEIETIKITQIHDEGYAHCMIERNGTVYISYFPIGSLSWTDIIEYDEYNNEIMDEYLTTIFK